MEFSARSQGLRVQFGLPERLLKFRLSKPRFRLSLGSRTDKKPAYNYLPVWLFICYARFQRKQETRSGLKLRSEERVWDGCGFGFFGRRKNATSDRWCRCRIQFLVAEGPLRSKAKAVGAALEAGIQEPESVSPSEFAEPVDSAEELDESEKNLRRAIDVIPALAWFAMPDGSMEYLNKRWRDYTGLSPAETVGWGFQAAFHPEDREKGIQRCRSLATENGPAECEIRLRRHDGVYRTVSHTHRAAPR